MLEGLVQHDHPLTIQHILDRMRNVFGDSEVVTLTGDGCERASYAEVARRADKLCRALDSLGVEQGDRVASFAWNTQRHLELYMGVPSMGAVLHMVNIRLFPEQLVYIVNHAKDKVLFVDDSLADPLSKLAPKFETVEHYVVMGDEASAEFPGEVHSYEELIGGQDEGYDYPELDDRAAAGLCYTSGTTGNPKGVLYSHRSNVLHSLATMTADAMGVGINDRVLPVVPMFHVNAWGIPYACAMSGADLVMPNRFLQGEPLAKLIESEKVTVAAGVPTIWLDLLRYADEANPDLSSLRMVPCGGSAVPLALMQAFDERHDVNVTQAWGMTETSPLGAVAIPPPGVEGDERWDYKTKAGRIMPFVEARLVGDDGEVPWDGESTGELQVRGPWIASAYYEDDSSDKFDDGWLKTGDIASIDEHGFVKITDRSKDVIKSGGEWISSVELEGELMAHPNVAEAAVIGRPDDKWGERPLACVVCEGGEQPSPEELREHLESRVAKWWLPEQFAFIDEVPKTSVGKFDKKVLRKQLEEGELEPVEAEGAEAAKA